MSESELEMMDWLKDRIEMFSQMMDVTFEESAGNSHGDYHYAEGSFDAYSVILKKLEGEDNK